MKGLKFLILLCLLLYERTKADDATTVHSESLATITLYTESVTESAQERGSERGVEGDIDTTEPLTSIYVIEAADLDGKSERSIDEEEPRTESAETAERSATQGSGERGVTEEQSSESSEGDKAERSATDEAEEQSSEGTVDGTTAVSAEERGEEGEEGREDEGTGEGETDKSITDESATQARSVEDEGSALERSNEDEGSAEEKSVTIESSTREIAEEDESSSQKRPVTDIIPPQDRSNEEEGSAQERSDEGESSAQERSSEEENSTQERSDEDESSAQERPNEDENSSQERSDEDESSAQEKSSEEEGSTQERSSENEGSAQERSDEGEGSAQERSSEEDGSTQETPDEDESSVQERSDEDESSAQERSNEEEESSAQERSNEDESSSQERSDEDESSAQERSSEEEGSTQERSSENEGSAQETSDEGEGSAQERSSEEDDSTQETSDEDESSTQEGSNEEEESSAQERSNEDVSSSQGRSDEDESSARGRSSEEEGSTQESSAQDEDEKSDQERSDENESSTEERSEEDEGSVQEGADEDETSAEARSDEDKSSAGERSDEGDSSTIGRSVEKNSAERRPGDEYDEDLAEKSDDDDDDDDEDITRGSSTQGRSDEDESSALGRSDQDESSFEEQSIEDENSDGGRSDGDESGSSDERASDESPEQENFSEGSGRSDSESSAQGRTDEDESLAQEQRDDGDSEQERTEDSGFSDSKSDEGKSPDRERPDEDNSSAAEAHEDWNEKETPEDEHGSLEGEDAEQNPEEGASSELEGDAVKSSGEAEVSVDWDKAKMPEDDHESSEEEEKFIKGDDEGELSGEVIFSTSSGRLPSSFVAMTGSSAEEGGEIQKQSGEEGNENEMLTKVEQETNKRARYSGETEEERGEESLDEYQEDEEDGSAGDDVYYTYEDEDKEQREDETDEGYQDDYAEEDEYYEDEDESGRSEEEEEDETYSEYSSEIDEEYYEYDKEEAEEERGEVHYYPEEGEEGQDDYSEEDEEEDSEEEVDEYEGERGEEYRDDYLEEDEYYADEDEEESDEYDDDDNSERSYLDGGESESSTAEEEWSDENEYLDGSSEEREYYADEIEEIERSEEEFDEYEDEDREVGESEELGEEAEYYSDEYEAELERSEQEEYYEEDSARERPTEEYLDDGVDENYLYDYLEEWDEDYLGMDETEMEHLDEEENEALEEMERSIGDDSFPSEEVGEADEYKEKGKERLIEGDGGADSEYPAEDEYVEILGALTDADYEDYYSDGEEEDRSIEYFAEDEYVQVAGALTDADYEDYYSEEEYGEEEERSIKEDGGMDPEYYARDEYVETAGVLTDADYDDYNSEGEERGDEYGEEEDRSIEEDGGRGAEYFVGDEYVKVAGVLTDADYEDYHSEEEYGEEEERSIKEDGGIGPEYYTRDEYVETAGVLTDADYDDYHSEGEERRDEYGEEEDRSIEEDGGRGAEYFGGDEYVKVAGVLTDADYEDYYSEEGYGGKHERAIEEGDKGEPAEISGERSEDGVGQSSKDGFGDQEEHDRSVHGYGYEDEYENDRYNYDYKNHRYRPHHRNRGRDYYDGFEDYGNYDSEGYGRPKGGRGSEEQGGYGHYDDYEDYEYVGREYREYYEDYAERVRKKYSKNYGGREYYEDYRDEEDYEDGEHYDDEYDDDNHNVDADASSAESLDKLVLDPPAKEYENMTIRPYDPEKDGRHREAQFVEEQDQGHGVGASGNASLEGGESTLAPELRKLINRIPQMTGNLNKNVFKWFTGGKSPFPMFGSQKRPQYDFQYPAFFGNDFAANYGHYNQEEYVDSLEEDNFDSYDQSENEEDLEQESKYDESEEYQNVNDVEDEYPPEDHEGEDQTQYEQTEYGNEQEYVDVQSYDDVHPKGVENSGTRESRKIPSGSPSEGIGTSSGDDYAIHEETETPAPLEVGYDFNVLDYGKFIDLSTDQFDPRILGLYTLKLGYYIRNNMINLLGFVMHQPYQDIGQNVFLKLHTLKEAFHHNLVDTFRLIPILAKTSDKDVNKQITAVMDEIYRQLKKKNCNFGCSAKYIKNQLASKKLDVRRIIAHLAYNPLAHNVYDQVTGKGVKEIQIIAAKIDEINEESSSGEADDEDNLDFFSPVVKRILGEVKEGKMILSEGLVGYLIGFYPWPPNDFKIIHAVDQIMLSMTNERDYMVRCRIIPEGVVTLVDHPVEFLVWVVTKIMDNVCLGHLHSSAKLLMHAVLNNRLMEGHFETTRQNENFVELNAVGDLLDVISFDKFPVEIVLATDRIRIYLEKVKPFVDVRNFAAYNYDGIESRLYAFLDYILDQTPHVHRDIKRSILAVKSHLVFHVRLLPVKFGTLIEMTNAWLAPDLLPEIKDQALAIRQFLLDEKEAINSELYGKPVKKCGDIQSCMVTGRELLRNAKFTIANETLVIPKCIQGRFLREKIKSERQSLNSIDLLDSITPHMYMAETVESVRKIKDYFREKDPILRDLTMEIKCSNPEVILQGFRLVLEKLTDIPIGIHRAMKAAIAELEFKVLPKPYIDTKVIHHLRIIYENTLGNEESLGVLEEMESFVNANEEQIDKVLIRIDPNKCRELLGCYNLIVDHVNGADLGYKMPYLYGPSPELSNLNLGSGNLTRFSVKSLLEIVDLVDEDKACSSEIVASKRHASLHEKELDSVLKTVNCHGKTLLGCFDLTYETLLYQQDQIPEVKLNIMQFLLQPTTCTYSHCQWLVFAEAGSIILNPLLEYITDTMERAGENAKKLHVQLDFYGLVVYLRNHNVNAVLKEYKLRTHVVDQTAISSFLDMVYELPQTSRNVKVSIDNLGKYLANQTEVFRGNIFLLVGVGKALMGMTPSVEIRIEIERNIANVVNREDQVMEAMRDSVIDCVDVKGCVAEIVQEFGNRSEAVPKLIYRVVSPSSCSERDCNWLTKPSPSGKSDLVADLIEKIEQNGKESDLNLLEKLSLEKMLESDMAFELERDNFTGKPRVKKIEDSRGKSDRRADDNEDDDYDENADDDKSDYENGDHTKASNYKKGKKRDYDLGEGKNESGDGGLEQDEEYEDNEFEKMIGSNKTPGQVEDEGDYEADSEGKREENDENDDGEFEKMIESKKTFAEDEDEDDYEGDSDEGVDRSSENRDGEDENDEGGDGAQEEDGRYRNLDDYSEDEYREESQYYSPQQRMLPFNFLDPQSNYDFFPHRQRQDFDRSMQLQIEADNRRKYWNKPKYSLDVRDKGVNNEDVLAILARDSMAHRRTKRVRRQNEQVTITTAATAATTITTAERVGDVTEERSVTQADEVEPTTDQSRMWKPPSIFDAKEEEDEDEVGNDTSQERRSRLDRMGAKIDFPEEENDKLGGGYQQVYSKLEEGVDGPPEKLSNFNAATLGKLVKMIASKVGNAQMQQLIARLQRELRRNTGEINFYLSQIEVDCAEQDRCLWDLNDGILRAKLDANPVFALILKVIRAEGCPRKKCPHKIEVTAQRFSKFIKDLISGLEIANNPQSNSFHFEMDIDYLVNFLRRPDISGFLPKKIAYNHGSQNLIKDTLVAVSKLKVPAEVSRTVRNLLNVLYKGVVPQHIHSGNVRFLVKAFFGLTNDSIVQNELLAQEKEVEERSVEITKLLGKVTVNCVTMRSCVQSLERKLITRKDKLAKALLRVLRPKSCGKSKCHWLSQSVQESFNEMRSMIMKELKNWHDNANSYLLKAEFQQFRYVIIAENLIANYLSLGDVDYDSPLLGILLTLNPKVREKYDLLEGVQVLIGFMLSRTVPDRASYRQLKHVCQKLKTKTDYVPSLNLMEESLGLFSRNMRSIKKALRRIDVRCKTFERCVKELIAGVNYKNDSTSKLIMDALAPSNCPRERCSWLSRIDEDVKQIKMEMDKVHDDDAVPLIIKLKLEFLISQIGGVDLKNFTGDINQTDTKIDEAFKTVLRNISADDNLDKSAREAAVAIEGYLENRTVPEKMNYNDFLTLLDKLIDFADNVLVKASMNIARNMYVRYRRDVESILRDCPFKCEEVKVCVDDILKCARKSVNDNADLIQKGLNPPQCETFSLCSWLNEITHEATLDWRLFKFNRTDYTKGMFPHDIIIFPPPNELQQAITFSLNHPNHIKNLIRIFPNYSEPTFGKQLTVINVAKEDQNHMIVLDFSLPRIFSKLQRVSGLRKPVINLRTFTECIIFVPIPNNQMRALRFDLTRPGVKEKLKTLAKFGAKKPNAPMLQIMDYDRAKYNLYIDIFDQEFMNKLLDCSIDRNQLAGYSILAFPSELGAPWKALAGSDQDVTLWNVLDIFSTVSVGDVTLIQRSIPEGIISFNFDVYNPLIMAHLNSLWKAVPQLDSRLDVDYVFYLPYQGGQFTALPLDLKDPLVVRKFDKLSRMFAHNSNGSTIPTFRIVGNEDYPDGLNVSLNFDDEKSLEQFLHMMTTSEFDDDSIKIHNIGLISTNTSYIALLWDVPAVSRSVKELGTSVRFHKAKKTINVLSNKLKTPVDVNLEDPVTQKLLRSISSKTMIPFPPAKIRANADTNLFVMGTRDPAKGVELFVIAESRDFYDRISKYNDTGGDDDVAAKGLRTKEEEDRAGELWTLEFELQTDTVMVNASKPDVYELLRSMSSAQEVLPIEEESDKDADPYVVLDFDEERFNYIYLSGENKTIPAELRRLCNGTDDDTELVLAENGTETKLNCDLQERTVGNALENVIVRIKSLPADNSIAVLHIPDNSGKLHPFIFDLNIEEVRRRLRRLGDHARPASTNKVAIYYRDKLRFPEAFVIDLETVKFEDLRRLQDYTPCDLIPTNVVNPHQKIDLVAFTIPVKEVVNCEASVSIILEPNDDLVVREVDLMEEPQSPEDTIIPITYKNGYKKTFKVPYLTDRKLVKNLRKLTVLSGLIKTPAVNLESIVSLEYVTPEGKLYVLTINTTNEATKTVLLDIADNAAETVPLAVVRGPNGENYETRLDLNDETVQQRLRSVAVTNMYIPDSNSLLILKRKGAKKPIILNAQDHEVVKQLLIAARNDKDKQELHVIQIRDTVGNRRVLRVDLDNEENLNILTALEQRDAEDTGPIFIPDEHKMAGLVGFRVVLNKNAIHSLVFNVSEPEVAETLAELHDPVKERTVAVPIYDGDGNELVTLLDLWDPKVLKVLLRLSATGNVPVVREPIPEDSGIAVIPLEFTKNGVFVVECNITDPNVTEHLFKIPGVVGGEKNPVYVPHPETEELVPLFFNPYDDAIVKAVRELCPVEEFINPDIQRLLVESFEDDCEPETLILDPEDTRVQEALDEIYAESPVGKETAREGKMERKKTAKRKPIPFSYRSKGKRKIVALDPEDPDQKRLMKMASEKTAKNYQPFITAINGKRHLVMTLDYEGRKIRVSFNLEDQSVIKALEELDQLSFGKGIKLPTGPYKTLIINVRDRRIRDKLIAIHRLYNSRFVKPPNKAIIGGRDKALGVEDDGTIVVKSISTTELPFVPTAVPSFPRYDTYDRPKLDDRPEYAADIPDLPGNYLPENPDDIGVFRPENYQLPTMNPPLNDALVLGGTHQNVEPYKPDGLGRFPAGNDDEGQSYAYGGFQSMQVSVERPSFIDPPVVPGEPELDRVITARPAINGVLEVEKVLEYIPPAGSLVMMHVEHEAVAGILILDLYDAYTVDYLQQISDEVKLAEATHIFTMEVGLQDHILIKLDCRRPTILSTLIFVSKATKNKLAPAEFPKPGGGYYVVFTVIDHASKENLPIVLDAEDAAVMQKIRSLVSNNPVQPILIELGKPETTETCVLDAAESTTLRELVMLTRNTKFSREPLKNVPVVNGIFGQTIRLPIIGDQGEFYNYIYNMDNPAVVDGLISESDNLPEDVVCVVLYAKKDQTTIPIRVDVKRTPSTAPSAVLTEVLPQEAVVFFIPSEKGTGADVIVLNNKHPNITGELYRYTKKRLRSDTMYRDKFSYAVLNMINTDNLPLEIRLDLNNPEDVAKVKELSELCQKPIAPFEIISPLGYKKLTILSTQLDGVDTVIALNPNARIVEEKVQQIFGEPDRDVFSIIRENEQNLFKPEVARELLDVSRFGIYPQEVPIFVPLDFIYFSIIDEHDEIVQLYIDAADPIALGRLFDITKANAGSVPDHSLKFFVYDLYYAGKVIKIDLEDKRNVLVLKEVSMQIVFPTLHEVFPPNSMQNLLVYSISNYGVNFNLTVNPSDERVVAIMEHNQKTLHPNSGVHVKFLTRLFGYASIPIKSEDFAVLSSFSPIQINPLVVIPCGGRGPLLNAMVPLGNGDWTSVTVNTNDAAVVERLQSLQPSNKLSTCGVVFYIADREPVNIAVDFSDERTLERLMAITAEGSITLIWRRYKNTIVKVCAPFREVCIYLDLQLVEVREKLMSMSRQVEDQDNLTHVLIRSAEGLQQTVYLPFLNPTTCSLDLSNYKELEIYRYNFPIPDFYVSLQNDQMVNVSPVKIMLAHQNYPIMMLDMTNTIFLGAALGDVTIDVNQAHVMNMIEDRRQTRTKGSLFELQDVNGNIFAFNFDFNKKPDLRSFRMLNDISLIQFRSNDLGLPTLIIDLINEDKLEVNLNLEVTLGVLKKITQTVPTENSYKIQIPQIDGYLIFYIDFNDENLLDELRKSSRNIHKGGEDAINHAIYESEHENSAYVMNFTDLHSMVWEITLCLADYYTIDALIGISVKRPSKFENYATLAVTDRLGYLHQIFLNKMSMNTLQTLKELSFRCTGRKPDVLAANSPPKFTISIDYTNAFGNDYTYVLDMNNKEVVEGLEKLSVMSENKGSPIAILTADGHRKMYNLNLEDPRIRDEMYHLRDLSLWNENLGGFAKKLRRKRSAGGPPPDNSAKIKRIAKVKKKHFWNVLKIDTPQTGLITFNFTTENVQAKNVLENLKSPTSKFSINTMVVQLFDESSNPYSIKIDMSNPENLKQLLILNRDLKRLGVPESDVVNKILFRYHTVLISDPFEKHAFTIDIYNQNVTEMLSKINRNGRGTLIEYFERGRLLKINLDTTRNGIKSMLSSISIQTLIFENSNYLNSKGNDIKLITIIFVENSTKPVVIDLADRRTIKRFIEIAHHSKSNSSSKSLAHFEVVDDFGQYQTVSIDLFGANAKNRLISKFGAKEYIKMTTARNKTYISVCSLSKTSNKYQTYKIPVSTESITKMLELEKLHGFTIKLSGEAALNKMIVFNMNPAQKGFDQFMLEGYLIKPYLPINKPKLWSIFVEAANKFVDVDLQHPELARYLKELDEEVDLLKPIAVVRPGKQRDKHLLINLDKKVLKKLKNRDWIKKGIGERKLVREKVEKLTNIRLPIGKNDGQSITFDLGDPNTLEAIRNFEYKEVKGVEPAVFYLDDAWNNPLVLKMNPFDKVSVNKLIHLGIN